MGVRNKKREILRRLDSKTLDARFLNEIRNGLNCSPFESEAVLEVVKEVYFPFLDEQSIKAPPGICSNSCKLDDSMEKYLMPLGTEDTAIEVKSQRETRLIIYY